MSNVSVLWSTVQNWTSLVIPVGCKLKITPTSVTQTGHDDLVSVQTENFIDFLKLAVVVPIMFIVGAPGNCLNMLIFCKFGLQDRINLCLFSLALVDFGFLCFLFLLSIDFITNPLRYTDKYGPFARILIENNVMGMYGLMYGSVFLTVVLACERCLCVLLPLHAKTLLKTKTMALIIAVGVCVSTLPRLFVLARYKLVCFLDSSNLMVSYVVTYSDFYYRYKLEIEGVDSIFYGIVMTLGCYSLVLASTIVTCVTLRQTIRWKKRASSSKARKEMALTKMLVYLSVQFLILSVPHVCIRILPLFGQELTGGGRYRNTYFVITSLAEIGFCLNSSSNILVYYIAGSRYRECLHSIWRKTVNKERLNKNTGNVLKTLRTAS